MTARTIHHCNCCGDALSAEQAATYAGLHMGATFAALAADGGSMDWHACDAECAASHLRDVADKVEAHAARLKADADVVEKNRADFAAATAPTPGAGPGSR